MLKSILNFFKGVVRLILLVFWFFYTWVTGANPGTLIGIGLGGCIGAVGSVWRFWSVLAVITGGFFGGFIGSGIYKLTGGPMDEQNRGRMLAALFQSIPRIIDNMLGSLLNFLKEVLHIIISVCEYIYVRLSLLNPGTQCGVGVAGFVCVIGSTSQLCDWTTGTHILVCIVGGFIGSGMYRREDRNRDENNRASEEQMFRELWGGGIVGNRRQIEH